MATKPVKGNTEFNSKHHGKGDPLPPYNGKLRLYNMRYCPYAHRIILALNAKQIDYDIVNIDLMNKPEWLPSKSPFGKVPSLEIKDGVCIYESLVIAQYLEEVYPQRPLLPKDPVARAFDKIIVEACLPIQTVFLKVIKAPNSITQDDIDAYQRALSFVQEQLKKRGNKYVSGNEPGYVDYMIWPWFEKMLVFQKMDERAIIDPQKYALLLQYFDNMFQDPVVSQYLVPSENLADLVTTYRQGKSPNYDLLPKT